jgi:hypothetical protein
MPTAISQHRRGDAMPERDLMQTLIEQCAFLVPMVPVMGFLIWYGRRNRASQRDDMEVAREAVDLSRENNRLIAELNQLLRNRTSF